MDAAEHAPVHALRWFDGNLKVHDFVGAVRKIDGHVLWKVQLGQVCSGAVQAARCS